MTLTNAMTDDILTIVNSFNKDNYYECRFTKQIALNLEQLIHLRDLFRGSYCEIKSATNWGTLHKFEVVVSALTLHISPENEEAFSALLECIHPALYPTENNFHLFLLGRWK